MGTLPDEILRQVASDLNAGRLSQAEWALRKALSRDPQAYQAMDLMAAIAFRQGRVNDAIGWAQQALRLRPQDPELHYNLAVMLAAAGRSEEASVSYEQAIRLRPEMFGALNNLGNILRSDGRLTEAAARFEQALAIHPTYALALNNLGLVLLEMGRIDEAMIYLRRALEAKPDFASAHSNMLLAMNSHEGFDRDAMFQAHREFAQQQAGRFDQPPPPRRKRAPSDRMRLGYISADFRSHSVSFFIEKILANHDRARFEVICYSSVTRPDAMTQRLRGYAEHWRDIAHLPDDQAAQIIRHDNLDILVELSGHTEGNRLLVMARRPAPIQVSYLGYPNTTGLDQIYYVITDAELAPDGTDAFYAEKVVRLPRTFFCYFGPELGIPIAPPPVERNGFITFGLLTNWVKVRPAMLNLWAQLLHAVPNSRIILKAKSLRDANLARQVTEFFTSAGVNAERVQIQSWTDFPAYLRLMADIDVGLDTYPFNGHTTTCHQLWMGVPMVTLSGETQASRMGQSILKSLDLVDLVARSPKQYLQIATDLARDVPRLKDLRASMRPRWQRSGLLNGLRFTREIEAAYEQMCALPM